MIRYAVAAVVLAGAGQAWAQAPDPEKPQELERLKTEGAAKDARLAELQKQLAEAQARIRKQEADLQVFMRQIETQLAQIQDLSARADAERAAQARAAAELDQPRKAVEQLHRQPPYRHPAVPAPAEVPGRGPGVTPVAPPAAPSAPLPKGSADELRALRSELDAVRRQVRALSDRLLPSFHDLGVATEPLSEELRTHLGLGAGVIVRQVREGSPAERAGLQPGDIVPGRTEAHLSDAIRQGSTLEVLRRGRSTLLPPNRGR